MSPLFRFPTQGLLKMHPAMLIFSSFAVLILAGFGLLLLPAATKTGTISPVDALFTATSAVCVTGLVVLDTGSYFTRFGQGVILLLIQIGGLGVMTVTVVLFGLLGRAISFRHRRVLQELFAHTPREDILRLVKIIFLFTAATEAVGTLLLFIHWQGDYSWSRALYISVFHSVSAFCNAGFSLFRESLTPDRGNLLLNVTVCGLIVLGGIGFPLVYDLYLRATHKGSDRHKFSVQSKTVLVTTAILILGGALLFQLLEMEGVLLGAPLSERILVSLFQSVTCRTAGFNTVDIAGLHDATLLLFIVLMFFGASPGSCGGGVKTTTLALVCASTWARIRRKKRVNLFRKSIPMDTIAKSYSLILTSIAIVFLVSFMLLLEHVWDLSIQPTRQREFLSYLFETASAFGTVGLSTGTTGQLGIWGKLWIILLMMIGRVGVLTFSYLLVGVGRTSGVEYAEENMMIG
jgi:trk system potassium uptake protein TrkH